MTSCAILSPCAWLCLAPLSTSPAFSPGEEEHQQGPSPKNLSECLIIIPDQNRPAYPYGRGTQVPGWPEQQASQDIVCWRRGTQIDRGDFLALRRD